ncbi:MAG: hypothetical protein JWQ16_240, partial [Novosphingobium sp.]|nr:hypothetical protein [Novosphingobium sp.]
MAGIFEAIGTNAMAPFLLKLRRGEGVALLAMDWRDGEPPRDFVGFGIEYAEPGSDHFWALKNRLTFEGNAGATPSAARPDKYSTLVAPIQKFRWVHPPFRPSLDGLYTYRVTAMFMNPDGSLKQGEAQTAAIPLADETYPGQVNVAFTRGFVSSQAFVDKYKDVDALLPEQSGDGLTFVPTYPDPAEAYDWMGFEARRMLLGTLDDAFADPAAQVGLVAYDLDLPEIIDRIIKLKGRVRVIIDNSDGHSGPKHAEDRTEQMLKAKGIPVVRQAMGSLQHNKTIYVDGPTIQRVICGSTNMSWRGLFVQSNNAFVVHGKRAVEIVKGAFETYWSNPDDFKASTATAWQSFDLDGIDAQ